MGQLVCRYAKDAAVRAEADKKAAAAAKVHAKEAAANKKALAAKVGLYTLNAGGPIA
jgi:hypothetical protein